MEKVINIAKVVYGDKNTETYKRKYKNIRVALNLIKKQQEKLENKDKNIQRMQELLDLAEAREIKKDEMIDLMSISINSYDSQLVINRFSDKEDVKRRFEREVEEN